MLIEFEFHVKHFIKFLKLCKTKKKVFKYFKYWNLIKNTGKLTKNKKYDLKMQKIKNVKKNAKFG